MLSNDLLEQIRIKASSRPRVSAHQIDVALSSARKGRLLRPPSDSRLLRLHQIRQQLRADEESSDEDGDEQVWKEAVKDGMASNVRSTLGPTHNRRITLQRVLPTKTGNSHHSFHNSAELFAPMLSCQEGRVAVAANPALRRRSTPSDSSHVISAWISQANSSIYWLKTLEGDTEVGREMGDISSMGLSAGDSAETLNARLFENPFGKKLCVFPTENDAITFQNSADSAIMSDYTLCIGPLEQANRQDLSAALELVDLADVVDVQPRTLSYILRLRFENQQLFVYSGPQIMIAMNPGTPSPAIFDHEQYTNHLRVQAGPRRHSRHASKADMPPSSRRAMLATEADSHVYSMVNRTLEAFRATGKERVDAKTSIVLHGVAGSGKSQLCRYVTEHFVHNVCTTQREESHQKHIFDSHLSSLDDAGGAPTMLQVVHSAFVILDSFTNECTPQPVTADLQHKTIPLTSTCSKVATTKFHLVDSRIHLDSVYITPYCVDTLPASDASKLPPLCGFLALLHGAHVFPELSERLKLSAYTDQAVEPADTPRDWDGSSVRAHASAKLQAAEWARQLSAVVDAFRILDISDSDAVSIFEVFALIIHLLRLEFIDELELGVARARVDHRAGAPDTLAAAASLLQVAPEKLADALTSKQIKLHGEQLNVPLNSSSANAALTQLCNFLYANAVQWLAARLNLAISHQLRLAFWDTDTKAFEGSPSLTVRTVDAVGFAVAGAAPDAAGWDILRRNLIAEHMYAAFCTTTLVEDFSLLADEGIHVIPVAYRDNSPLLEMFENPSAGIVALLDFALYRQPTSKKSTFGDASSRESTATPGGTLSKHIATSKFRGGLLRMDGANFFVSHTATEATYDTHLLVQQATKAAYPLSLASAVTSLTDGQLIQNLLRPPVADPGPNHGLTRTTSAFGSWSQQQLNSPPSSNKHLHLISSSNISKISEISDEDDSDDDSDSMNNNAAVSSVLHSPEGDKKPLSPLARFRSDLASMLAKVESDDIQHIICLLPRFRPCTSPNADWEEKAVLHQLNASGLIDALILQQRSYPISLAYKEFLQRYWFISPSDCKVTAGRPLAEILHDSGITVGDEAYRVGGAAQATHHLDTQERCRSLVRETLQIQASNSMSRDTIAFGKTRIFMKLAVCADLENARAAVRLAVVVRLQKAFRQRMWCYHVHAASSFSALLKKILLENLAVVDIPRLLGIVEQGRKLRIRPQLLDAMEQKLSALTKQEAVLKNIQAFLASGDDGLAPAAYDRLSSLCNDAQDLGISALDPVIAANKIRSAVADRMDSLAVLRDGIDRCDIAAINRGIDMIAGLQHIYPGFGQSDVETARQISMHLIEESVLAHRALKLICKDRCADVSQYSGKLYAAEDSITGKLTEMLLFTDIDTTYASIAFPLTSALSPIAELSVGDRSPEAPSTGRRRSVSSGTSARLRRASSADAQLDGSTSSRTRRLSAYEQNLGLTSPGAGKTQEGQPRMVRRSASHMADSTGARSSPLEDPGYFMFALSQHLSQVACQRLQLDSDPNGWHAHFTTAVKEGAPLHGELEKMAARRSLLTRCDQVSIQGLLDLTTEMRLRTLLSPYTKMLLRTCTLLAHVRRCANEIIDNVDGVASWAELRNLLLPSSQVSVAKQTDVQWLNEMFVGYCKTFGTKPQPSLDEPSSHLPYLHPLVLRELWGCRLAYQNYAISRQVSSLMEPQSKLWMGPMLSPTFVAYRQHALGAWLLCATLEQVEGSAYLSSTERDTVNKFLLSVGSVPKIPGEIGPVGPEAITYDTAIALIMLRLLARMRLAMAIEFPSPAPVDIELEATDSIPQQAARRKESRFTLSTRLSLDAHQRRPSVNSLENLVNETNAALPADDLIEPDWDECYIILDEFHRLLAWLQTNYGCVKSTGEFHRWHLVGAIRRLAIVVDTAFMSCKGGICWSSLGPLPWIAEPDEEIAGKEDMQVLCGETLDDVAHWHTEIMTLRAEFESAAAMLYSSGTEPADKALAKEYSVWKLATMGAHVLEMRSHLLSLALRRMGYESHSSIAFEHVDGSSLGKNRALIVHSAAMFRALEDDNPHQSALDHSRIMEACNWGDLAITLGFTLQLLEDLHKVDLESLWPVCSMVSTKAGRRSADSGQIWVSKLLNPTPVMQVLRHDTLVFCQALSSQAVATLIIPLLADCGALAATIEVNHAAEDRSLQVATPEFDYYTRRLGAACEAAVAVVRDCADICLAIKSKDDGEHRPAQGIICKGANQCWISEHANSLSITDVLSSSVLLATRLLVNCRRALLSGNMNDCADDAVSAELLLRIISNGLDHYEACNFMPLLDKICDSKLSPSAVIEFTTGWAVESDILGIELHLFLQRGFASSSPLPYEASLRQHAREASDQSAEDPIGEQIYAQGIQGRMTWASGLIGLTTRPLIAYSTVLLFQRYLKFGSPIVDHLNKKLRTDCISTEHLLSAQALITDVFRALYDEDVPTAPAKSVNGGITLQQLAYSSWTKLEEYRTCIPNVLTLRNSLAHGDWLGVRKLFEVDPTPGTEVPPLRFPSECEREIEAVKKCLEAVSVIPEISARLVDGSVSALLQRMPDRKLTSANLVQILTKLEYAVLEPLLATCAASPYITDEQACLILSTKHTIDLRRAASQLAFGRIRAISEVIKSYDALTSQSIGLDGQYPRLLDSVVTDARILSSICVHIDLLFQVRRITGVDVVLPLQVEPLVESGLASAQFRLHYDAVGANDANTKDLMLVLEKLAGNIAHVNSACIGESPMISLPSWVHSMESFAQLSIAWAEAKLHDVVIASQQIASLHVDDQFSTSSAFRDMLHQARDAGQHAEWLLRSEEMLILIHRSAENSCPLKSAADFIPPLAAMNSCMTAAGEEIWDNGIGKLFRETLVLFRMFITLLTTEGLSELHAVEDAILAASRFERVFVSLSLPHCMQSRFAELTLKAVDTLRSTAALWKCFQQMQKTAALIEVPVSIIFALVRQFMARGVCAATHSLEELEANIQPQEGSSVDIVECTFLTLHQWAANKHCDGDHFRVSVHLVANAITMLHSAIAAASDTLDRHTLERCLSICKTLDGDMPAISRMEEDLRMTDEQRMTRKLDAALAHGDLQTAASIRVVLKGLSLDMEVSLIGEPTSDHEQLIPGYHVPAAHPLHLSKLCPRAPPKEILHTAMKKSAPLLLPSLEGMDLCSTISTTLLAVGGELSFTYPQVLGSRVMELAIASTDFADELYAQLLCQLNGNPSASSRLNLWAFLYCLIHLVRPTERVESHVDIAIRTALQITSLHGRDGSPWQELLLALHVAALTETHRFTISADNVKEASSRFIQAVHGWLAMI